MQDASTIERIRRKFDALGPVMDERMRRQWAAAEAADLGWGGVSAVATATGLLPALEALVDPVTRGDPESPLRWTCKSTRRLAEELTRQGHPVSPRSVAALLKAAGYSLQANQKT